MLTKFIAIIVGSITLAIGVNFFLVPFRILDGGMIGVALILHYLWGLKAGGTIIILSIPIYILAWFFYRSLFFNSVNGMLISSLFIDLLRPEHYQYIVSFHLSPVVGAIAGGFMVGIGIGVMLRNETSTGGIDLLAQLIASRLPLNVGLIIFVIDGLIISVGGILLSSQSFYLSLLTIMIVGMLTSICVYGHRWDPKQN